MECGAWDGDYTLGPFYDQDGTDILPCTTEATDELLAECMGYYRLKSNMAAWGNTTVLLSNQALTEYIQKNWDEVMGGDAWDGFLLAYLIECKASFARSRYLKQCLPKAFSQLRHTAQINPSITAVLLLLISVRQKEITVLRWSRLELLEKDISSFVTDTRELLTSDDSCAR